MMNGNINGQNSKQRQDTCIASKYSPRTCINYYGDFNTSTKCLILLPSENWVQFSYSLVWVGFNDSVVKNRICKGKNRDFTVEKPGRYNLRRGIKVKVRYSVGSMCLCWMQWQAFHLCGILPQDPRPQCNHEKTPVMPKSCFKTSTSNLQNLWGFKKQENTEKMP